MALQTNTIALLAAGEARYDGAGAVITFGTAGTAPTYTSAASSAAYLALYAVPTANSNNTQYVTSADFYVEGADCFITKTAGATAPTAVNGIKWPIGSGESFRNSPEMIRSLQIFAPAAAKVWVTLYYGSL